MLFISENGVQFHPYWIQRILLKVFEVITHINNGKGSLKFNGIWFISYLYLSPSLLNLCIHPFDKTVDLSVS
jgi:hypothetical protein